MKKLFVFSILALLQTISMTAGAQTKTSKALDYELDARGKKSLQAIEQNIDVVDQLLFEQMQKENAFDFFSQIADQEGEDLTGSSDLLWDVARKKRRSKCTPQNGRILMGCCGMYVRLYLDSKGQIPDGYRLGQAARGFGKALSRVGFCNRIGHYGRDPENAPYGAVLVYTGGPWGHVEVKTRGGYYFGPTNEMPATQWRSPRRILTGIWEKCE